MPQYRVLTPSMIANRLVQPGAVVELPATILPAANLEALDDAGRALQAEHRAQHAGAMPAGSQLHRESTTMLDSRGPSESQIKAMHTPIAATADDGEIAAALLAAAARRGAR